MTTLTNPTDAELNDCFAKHVCWLELHSVDDFSGERSYRRLDGHVMVMEHGGFLKSMDAVLPWLDRCREIGLWVTICDHTNGINHGERDWLVSISNRDEREWNFDGNGWMFWEVANPSLPRACVLALLKAHGVGVVYGASSKTELQ
jgi:hypothetical protein